MRSAQDQPSLWSVQSAGYIRRMAFSSFGLGRVMSLPQPLQIILTSLPTRMTLKAFSPHGCGFFSSTVSPTDIFGMDIISVFLSHRFRLFLKPAQTNISIALLYN